jgi:hypothetical protein
MCCGAACAAPIMGGEQLCMNDAVVMSTNKKMGWGFSKVNVFLARVYL